MTISCRICHKKTHTPLTCEEAKENGTRGARITIEEAMSDAVIRSCNKCKFPVVSKLIYCSVSEY
jgi:TRIAD3 protein (E3 ubiquitin-protein ligase RNF216)